MDAVSTAALGAAGIAFDEKRHVAGCGQRAQPKRQVLIAARSILAKQNTGNVGRCQSFGQASLVFGRKCRWKREIKPARSRCFSHVAASACLSLRNGAVLFGIVSVRLKSPWPPRCQCWAPSTYPRWAQAHYPRVNVGDEREEETVRVDHWCGRHHIVL